MNGLDWAAFPIMVERFGVTDVDVFMAQLVAIREHKEKQHEHPGR